jgi:5-oxoprolinase (ATP-hydrolysing)
MSGKYQVWCDVGGTFTDCFVTDPLGQRQRLKVLSHGRMPGHIDRWCDPNAWIDARCVGQPEGFWASCRVVLFDADRQAVAQAICKEFDGSTGRFVVSDWKILGSNDLGGSRMQLANSMVGYELISGLEAPVLATRLMLRVPLSEPLPRLDIRLGTTRATNALLTRTGEPTALLTTEGFEDLLEIGYQERPELFAICVSKRSSLYAISAGIRERLDAQGRVLVPLDLVQAREQLLGLLGVGIRSLAICFLHAYRNSSHEQQVAELAMELGFQWVFCSSRVAPVIRAVSRGETTLVDAYLTPVVRRYLSSVRDQFCEDTASWFRVMTSSGGLIDARDASGKELVLSGPAGGAVALQAIAKQYDTPKLIGLDMGGTSTDVCRIDGRLQLEYETIKAGVRMSIPTLAIHTVASGGGSICSFDGVQLRVGPKSAGSDPGPACYGRGGPLTITDLNLLEGRIDPQAFPIPLYRESSTERLNELLDQVRGNVLFESMDAGRLTEGLRRIANEQMAAAVRAISIEQGADPRDHVLVGFGGAAGQHICEIAQLLDMDRIIDPPEAGLLSALGMGLAQVTRSASYPIYRPLSQVEPSEYERIRNELADRLSGELAREGIDAERQIYRGEVELRYVGSEGSLRIFWDDQPEGWPARFESAYREKFGVVRLDHPLELTCLWLQGGSPELAIGQGANRVSDSSDASNLLPIRSGRSIPMVIGQRPVQAARWDRGEIQVGAMIAGPALIQSLGSTTIIDPGWQAVMQSDGSLRIDRAKKPVEQNLQRQHEDKFDPVLREVLAQRIAAIADQMGIVLEQTATSVNVKQRRDFSCAVFDARGELIANAPHVPVHLGAMGRTVQAMIERFPRMHPGDSFVTNDPYQGGSHLPDVTLVTPVFDKNGSDRPAFFVASRAHHAEIGGIAPGSMAPTATRLGQEGVILPPMHWTEQGVDRPERVEALLLSAQYPTRNVAENMADLLAQQAANQRGVLAMQALAESLGVEYLQTMLESILDVAKAKTVRWIDSLPKAEYRFEDAMDDRTQIAVRITKQQVTEQQGGIGAVPSGARLVVDFEGTGLESIGNLNANPGIVTAAVMYTIRCAIGDSMPLNSGVMRAVELKIPPGILNPRGKGPKEHWPAVAGGNVETSQRIVDVLWGALGLAAASQGTMNNFLFGNSHFGYYETIGGGTGASQFGPGAHAVHSHMTNTRLTDVEVLESRYPVRVISFGVRRSSGGKGHYEGGSGMVREVMALEPLEVSLVTSRRGDAGPYGLQEGESGLPGENWWIGTGDQQRRLEGSCQLRLKAGERIRIMTPGGGGFGSVQLR